jgi:hypothetical protein
MVSLLGAKLTAGEAVALLRSELAQAAEALNTPGSGLAVDGYVGALGLALQLGPAATEQVLWSLLSAARELAGRQDVVGLSTLGPALVAVVSGLREAEAMPPTNVMEAWATVVADVAAVIGEIGLALSVSPDRRQGMILSACTRAALLDDATRGRFNLVEWLAGVSAG